ncbi:conserved hypothetical protein [Bosea sp. 62]|nr:conserved hypothetical protein [Bosea sp. 7B]CAD5277006.1 conserved hypothetical protein [Bosea sp. 21B]CAD5278106.1 conserved hypothetical protein [Bosea sp. 46]VVT59819.1 conserved hypothetical protein [Bosea sp. EC-HK365B]VXB44569.1 conserved hypothetical protein [Bosea sp. 62]VXC06082.1 conserved hypothetical protein [Bosea sp. 127]VXC24380.1 conserved hypothetical protein [Bosea sp. 29B]VXC76131.1 conserved hypothetical protein [Bosea sp. 125]
MSSVRPAQSPKPTLADYAALFIRCEDCGNAKRMGPETLSSLYGKGFQCDADLKPKLICQPCKDRGAYGRNLFLIPTFRRG